MRALRLGVMYEDGTANSHYRAILPMREMQRRGHRVAWPENPSLAMRMGRLPACDLIHIHRFVMQKDLELVHRLRDKGIAVSWDTDDDISAIPRGTRQYHRAGGRRKIKEHFERSVEIARAADLITTPSKHLAELYLDRGVEHATVIENHVAPGSIIGRRRRHAGVVIGLTAAAEHERDFKKMRLNRTLHALLVRHPGLRVLTIGVDLRLGHPRHIHRRVVPIDRLTAYESEFDIGIAPLLDSPLNRSRSNVKLKEYAAAGAMWLASPRGPYVGMGEEQGGLLVDDDDWGMQLDALIVDHERRTALAQRARAWVRTEAIHHAGRAWERAFRFAIAQARERARGGTLATS